MTIHETLLAIHDQYVGAVNQALSTGDLKQAEALADEFDVEVLDTLRARIAA